MPINKYYSGNCEKPSIPTPPKEPEGRAYPTPTFPQYPDTEQKGLGKV